MRDASAPPYFTLLFTCNAGYLDHCLFAAWQARRMLDAGPSPSQTAITIASADLDIQHQIEAAGHRFLPLTVDDFIAHLPANERLKHYTYWRLPAIEAASALYDRILYLDTDVLVLDADLDRLFTFDLQGAPVAAVRDVHQRHRPNRMPREFAALGLPNGPYFNAGVLLIESKAWRDQQIMVQLTQMAQDHGPALSAHDQSLLNLVFRTHWVELSPVWNWQYSKKIAALTGHVGVHLVHIAGPTKLWDRPDGNLPKAYVELYRQWQTHQGKIPFEIPRPRIHQRVDSVIKTLWYLRSTWKDLYRFETDMTPVWHRISGDRDQARLGDDVTRRDT